MYESPGSKTNNSILKFTLLQNAIFTFDFLLHFINRNEKT